MFIGADKICAVRLHQSLDCARAYWFFRDKNVIVGITGEGFIIARTSEDYAYWLRALQHTNSIYVKDVCFYYDNGHGDGQNYE